MRRASRLGSWSAATLIIVIMISISGCVSGTCHHLRQPDLAQNTTPPAPGMVKTPAAPSGSGGVGVTTQKDGPKDDQASVFVYKADGSLQCGKGRAQSPEEMEKQQLGGIQVLSRSKKSDGLMHIQVCGSPTGQINVFEIAPAQLKEAEKRGFKRL